jgi:hypothetical protein
MLLGAGLPASGEIVLLVGLFAGAEAPMSLDMISPSQSYLNMR